MKIDKTLAIIVLFSLVVSGCISSSPKKPNRIAEHIAKGESLEKDKRFSSALEQYKLALTIDPENEEAFKHKEKLLPILQKAAQDHYRQGLAFDKQGKYDLARKEYLAALQNWPEHKQAKNKLTPGVVADKPKEYIIHTLTYGDSVSKLGKIYYGNFKKHYIIGKFNKLKDATKVRIGQKLKIPVADGVSLKELEKRKAAYFESRNKTSAASKPKKIIKAEAEPYPEEEVKTEPVPDVKDEVKTEPMPDPEKEIQAEPAPDVNEEVKAEPVPDVKDEVKTEPMPDPEKEIQAEPEPEPVKDTMQAVQPTPVDKKEPVSYTQGIELFNQKKYPEAISFFLASKEVDPEDDILMEYLFKSHFQQGILLFNSEDYLPAKENFESALSYNKACDNCPEYIEKCETTYKEKHYNLGIHYFGKEQLNKAIEEWKRVKEIDPNYKDVTPNLKKAILLFKRLESIKQSKTE